MVSRPLSQLSAVRKQNLLIEFSSLKQACPYGIYMSLTPGDATLWSGVIFVRKGPYSPSLLRFQISFPPSYPSLPPLVTFSTDIFHPLITPLTTYMYTTDIQDSGTVSATDEERLPPGGFSLRHGFPGWFGRGKRRVIGTPGKDGSVGSPGSVGSGSPTPGRTGDSASTNRTIGATKDGGGVYEVLRYIRSAFDEEAVLDAIPLEAAGNPGAWHAWRTHRVKAGKVEGSKSDDGEVKSPGIPAVARSPGEWNWDGVWEVRVKKQLEASLSEAALFGRDGGDDLIRFLNMGREEVESVVENMRRSVESEPMRRGIV